MSDKKKFKIKIHFGKVSAILLAVFAVLLAADLILKFCEVKYDWNFTVIPKLIWVESGIKNWGAGFSFLADKEWGRIFFIVLTFIMLIIMTGAYLLLPERAVGLKVALVLIAAGAMGNLIDRLAFGYVRDFVWVNIFGVPACCNFADFWIVFGMVWGIIDILFLNEWALFPLTKKAKAAAKLKKQAEEKERESADTDDEEVAVQAEEVRERQAEEVKDERRDCSIEEKESGVVAEDGCKTEESKE